MVAVERNVAASPATAPPYKADAMTATKKSGVDDGWTYGHTSHVSPVATATEPSGISA